MIRMWNRGRKTSTTVFFGTERLKSLFSSLIEQCSLISGTMLMQEMFIVKIFDCEKDKYKLYYITENNR